MCYLYSFRKTADETRSLFKYLENPGFPPRAHVAPQSPIAIIRTENNERHFTLVSWGLIPSWVKEIKPGKRLINARSETLLEKPSFRNAIRRRRCLIPADGYYEWLGDVPGKKIPYFVHRPDHGLFAFAGLWEHWLGADGSELETATIITTTSNRVIAQINDRMPVVIHPENFAPWFDVENVEAEKAVQFLNPAPENYFVFEPTVIAQNAPPAKPKAQLNLF